MSDVACCQLNHCTGGGRANKGWLRMLRLWGVSCCVVGVGEGGRWPCSPRPWCPPSWCWPSPPWWWRARSWRGFRGRESWSLRRLTETLPLSCEEKGERYFSRRKRMVLNERYLVGELILGLDDNMNNERVHNRYCIHTACKRWRVKLPRIRFWIYWRVRHEI